MNQFQRDLKALRDEPTCTGTDWIRAHAVVVLYVDKLNDMVHRPDSDEYGRAYYACQAIVATINPDPSETTEAA